MRMLQFLKKYCFFLMLVAAFFAMDMGLSRLLPSYAISSGRFRLNDFEIVRRDHPEKVWDKVFFGNSVVISAYREEESESGYINLGLDYGVVRDLWEMVDRGDAEIGSELVLGLNDLTLYDKFETDPSYPWHQEWYEPYSYFARDRLNALAQETARQVFTDFNPPWGKYFTQTRPYYYSSMSKAELDDKVAKSKYMALPIEDFEENFRCVENLAKYCGKKGARMRVVWMPLNPEFTVPESTLRVKERTMELCAQLGVEFYDMSDALETPCFYDIGHLNHEYGAYVFTEEIEPWLLS